MLERARVFGTVADAVADCTHVYATTVRKRGVTKPVVTPEEAARAMRAEPGRSALLFGPERSGLETDDVALVLHTSGTTARPKIVPLTHGNVTASARSIARTLELSPGDACLNVMPLFHIHGLIAATLASLAGGGSVVCTPGFNALRFFGWLDAERPTWYTAVPTMHQAILARAERNKEIIERAKLRFLRSSSANIQWCTPPPLRPRSYIEEFW